MPVLVFQTKKEVILMFRAAGSGDILCFLEQGGGKLLSDLTELRILLEPGWDHDRLTVPLSQLCHTHRPEPNRTAAFPVVLVNASQPQARIQGCSLLVPIDGRFLMYGASRFRFLIT